MNNAAHIFRVSTVALALVCGSAISELAAANEDCDTIMGFSGHTRRELFPTTCEQTTADKQVSGKTREQVKAELAEAQKNGTIVTSFVAKQVRDIYPGNYPDTTGSANQDGGKTREQVKAELAEAQKNGDIVVSFAARPAHEVHPGEYPEAATDLAKQDPASLANR
jgi:hypothetical protein